METTSAVSASENNWRRKIPLPLLHYIQKTKMPDTESSLQEELTESSLAYIQRRRLKRDEMIELSFIPRCVLWARLHNHFDTISVIQATRSASGTTHNRIRCTTSGLEWPFHLFSAKGELTFWFNSSVKMCNTVCYKYDQSLYNVLNNV